MIAESGREILLGVDGGVTQKNLAEVGALGADLVVTGSAVFSGGEPAGNVAAMLEALRGAPG
jgi:ribulose-phosphate 3-epimerase